MTKHDSSIEWPRKQIWFYKCRTNGAKKASDYAAEQGKIEEESRVAAKKLAEEARKGLVAAKKKFEAEAAAKRPQKGNMKKSGQKPNRSQNEVSRKASMVKQASHRIVALWVDGIWTKSEMFKMLQVFGDKLPAWDRELAQFEPNEPHQGRGDTIFVQFCVTNENIDDSCFATRINLGISQIWSSLHSLNR